MRDGLPTQPQPSPKRYGRQARIGRKQQEAGTQTWGKE